MIAQKQYAHPVVALLTHGPVTAEATEPWFDYVGHYGLTASDIPALISLVQAANGDDERQLGDGEAIIHVCRALGQLGDAQAVSSLVQLLDDGDRLIKNVLVALSMLGPETLEALRLFFNTPETSIWSRIEAAAGFRIFAQRNPLYRDKCIAFLTHALSHGTKQVAMLNGFLVYNLIELEATEVADIIEQAFQDNRVDNSVSGQWPDVKIQLGLATTDDFAPDELMYAGELYEITGEAN